MLYDLEIKILKVNIMKLRQFIKSRYIKFGVIIVAVFSVLAIIAIYVCNYMVLKSTENRMFDKVSEIPPRRVALLLGTNPKGRKGNDNIFYKRRINATVELYQNGKIERILISGDNSTKSYSEPDQMKADLVALGIPDSVIYLDFAGFRTLDSVIRAKEIFGQTELIIISQQFHNERAIYIASHYGIDAIAFNAGNVKSSFWQITMKIREWLARVNAVIDVKIGTKPHFLGEPIEIK